jgi:hypothetical protein
MKKLFGNIKMTWPRVILFAVITGIYTGLVLIIDALKDTSFQDIGIAYEWWVIFAVIVVVNCKSNLDAMLKCFVFFLISQPVIFAVQVPFGKLSAEQGVYYYKNIWFFATLLTLPGGWIAYYAKRQNLFGAAVLGIGNTIQLVMACSYAYKAIADFPYHLLSTVVSVASMFIMSFCIQKKARCRAVSLCLPLVLAGALAVFAYVTGRLNF